MTATFFRRFAWFVIFYNFLVVAFGAFVRASFSGDGCGANWPICGTSLFPKDGDIHKMVEFTHRASSGVVLVLVAALYLLSFKLPKTWQTRKLAAWSLFFTCSEALIGALLVTQKWVAHNTSAYRAMAMCMHLTNTLFLLGFLTLTAISASEVRPAFRLKGQGSTPYLLAVGAAGLIILAMTGALSALGHTLYPVDNVVAAATAANANPLQRLQLAHPLVAGSVGLYLLLMGGLMLYLRPSPQVRARVVWMVSLYCVQAIIGLISISTNAPIGLQLLHLFSADAVWVSFILLAAGALSEGVLDGEADPNGEPIPSVRPKGRQLVSEYVKLTKPKVISLLLFTTLTPMFAATPGWPGGWLLLAVAVGGYMAAGAANAINMVIDRDIDRSMRRTSTRPTVTQNIPSRDVMLFALAMAIGSFAILTASANLLCAMLAMAGLVFYVIVYTMALKRRTWQNIVIGGAAGAFPPLVGWSAVTNSVPAFAWFLFAIVFLWTPVHFWALALLIKEDYASAGIPMLPVVHGDRVTAIQIIFYGVLTAIVSILPLIGNSVGALYVCSAVLLNIVLLVRCVALYRNTDRPHAVSLYKYSMLYLAGLFLMVAIDQVVIH